MVMQFYFLESTLKIMNHFWEKTQNVQMITTNLITNKMRLKLAKIKM